MKKMMPATLAMIAALQMTAAVSSLNAQSASRSSGGATVKACTLLSAAEIKSITRRSDLATSKPHIEEGPDRSNCIYPGAQSVGITVQTTSKELFDKMRDIYMNTPPTYKLITFERASGVGEEAYFLTHNDTQNVVKLVARVGLRELTIAVERAGSQKPQVAALAKAAAAKLR